MNSLTPRKRTGLYCLLVGLIAVAAQRTVDSAAHNVPPIVGAVLHLSSVVGCVLLIFGIYRLIRG
jgi:hypothetical protein